MPPRLALSLGDPAGIGPEVVEAALQQYLAGVAPLPVTLVGPAGLVDGIAARTGGRVQVQAQAAFDGPIGTATAAGGRAALHALDGAIALAEAGAAAGIVTAPINKLALARAGSTSLGHTEILAQRLGRGPVAMAFITPHLRVVLATTHIPLREVVPALQPARVAAVAGLLRDALATDAAPAPRLALAGLNPHAGESGLIGDEEARLLAPAVARARAAGIDLSDPLSPDTVFKRAVDGEFDGVVALYHDQGLIPIKLLAFGAAVNVTLGLRVVRTSPDHGTAYDRAGTGTARPDGMLAAILAADQMVRARPRPGGAAGARGEQTCA